MLGCIYYLCFAISYAWQHCVTSTTADRSRSPHRLCATEYRAFCLSDATADRSPHSSRSWYAYATIEWSGSSFHPSFSTSRSLSFIDRARLQCAWDGYTRIALCASVLYIHSVVLVWRRRPARCFSARLFRCALVVRFPYLGAVCSNVCQSECVSRKSTHGRIFQIYLNTFVRVFDDWRLKYFARTYVVCPFAIRSECGVWMGCEWDVYVCDDMRLGDCLRRQLVLHVIERCTDIQQW